MFELIEQQESMAKDNSPEEFEVDSLVKVRKVNESQLDPEDYFYLKDFSEKKGKIIAKSLNSRNIYSYKVDFGKGLEGYFYADDFIEI